MEPLFTLYQFLFFLSYGLLAGAYSPHNSNCAPGIQSVGVTVPKGDIKIEYGNPLEIFCVLDPTQTNLNASSLVFYFDGKLFPKEYLQIVNSTTLRLYVEKPPINMSSLVSCNVRKSNNTNDEEGVCLNYVSIGTKPKEVRNFSCVSYNWESLNCSWVPEPNPVQTVYTLSYTLKMKRRKVYPCPGNSDVDHNFCLWNSTTNPPHRMPYETYFFQLTGSNIFGNLTKTYTVNHYSVVLPRKPENLSLVEATSSSLAISWSLPLALKEFPGGIVSKVLYQSRWDSSNYWQEVDTSKIRVNGSGQYVLNITGLKYPHTLYDIRVLLKSKMAEDIDKWWSEPAKTTLRTKPTVPGMPPKTDIGSFESLSRAHDPDQRNIYVYWQQIPQWYENGEHFGYNISNIEEIVNGQRIQRNITPEIDRNRAAFDKMSYNTYIFEIVSYNKEGFSKNHSTIVVPSRAKSPAEPVSFTKIAYDHGVYELSWNAPPHDPSSLNKIQSYTIFWCDNKNDKPYQCNGVLNWTRVDNNVTEKNITLPVDKIFQFAISANTHDSSSGMVWADCTVLPDQERGKLKNIWINRIGSNFMELSWKLDCLRSRSISGFEVTYCPIVGPQDSSCKEGKFKQTTFEGNHTTSHYTIRDLRPYTTYKVSLAVVSTKGSLIKSDPLLNTTLEAVPDGAPENLKVLKVTNTSITLSWSPPWSLNGVLRNYNIYLNNESAPITVDADKKSPFVKYTLQGLSSYENYLIKVVACTLACSNKTSEAFVKTKIGTPGQLSAPSVGIFNKTDLNITWLPLKSKRGGKNEFYVVKTQLLSSKSVVLSETERIVNNTSGKYGRDEDLQILTPGCSESDAAHLYNIWVRVINIGEDGHTHFYGPWSPKTPGFCMSYSNNISLPYLAIFAVCGVAAVCFFLGVLYATRCIWVHCKAMQNIRVKLPPQLEMEIYKGEARGDLPMAQHIPHPKPPMTSDNNDTPPPNQPLLPEKKEKDDVLEGSLEDCEDTGGDGDSSGCGSGHESVSSSITAGTHITDSGTEADESLLRLQKPEDVFADSPRREMYPRQRNNISRNSGGDGYCILAQAPSGYVSLPPSTYVKHDWTPPIKPYDVTLSGGSPNTVPPTRQSTETSWAS